MYPFTGLDHWTGILDWTAGLNFSCFGQVALFILTYIPVAEEAVQKWGVYLNFQDTFVWRNLHSYEGLVKSGGLQPP